jgi:spore germination protein KC
MKRRCALLCLMACILLLCAGCWDYHELENYSIVAGAAFDQGVNPGEYHITMEIVSPTAGESINPTAFTVSAEATTIFSAIRDTISKTGKRAYWAHAAGIVISADLARQGLAPLLDLLMRDAEMRTDMLLFVAEEEDAKSILGARSEALPIVSLQLKEAIQNETYIAWYYYRDIWDFISNVSDLNLCATIPLVKLSHDEGNPTLPMVEGMALFHGDHMIGTLSGEEVQAVRIMRGDLGDSVLAFNNIGPHRDREMSLEMQKDKCRIEMGVRDDKLFADIHVRLEGDIGEMMGPVDFDQPGEIQELERQAAEQVKSRIEQVMEKMLQEYHADLLCFSEKLQVSNYAEWQERVKHWHQELNEMQYSVTAEVKITGSSLFYKPIHPVDA